MTKKEKQLLIEIMSRYNKVYFEMEILEQSLEQLHTTKDTLLTELKLIRKKESAVLDTLKEKYGEDAGLDLKTLELL
jgi:hypothetical protein